MSSPLGRGQRCRPDRQDASCRQRSLDRAVTLRTCDRPEMHHVPSRGLVLHVDRRAARAGIPRIADHRLQGSKAPSARANELQPHLRRRICTANKAPRWNTRRTLFLSSFSQPRSARRCKPLADRPSRTRLDLSLFVLLRLAVLLGLVLGGLVLVSLVRVRGEAPTDTVICLARGSGGRAIGRK
jgi:hypothetical protein